MKKIAERFDLENASLYGGAITILDYINGTGLKEEFGKAVKIAKHSVVLYKMEHQLTSMVIGRLLGLERLYHFETTQEDPLISQKLGLDKLSDYTVLYKDIGRFVTEEEVKGLEDVLRSYAQRTLKGQEYAILDIDSTVETVYGEQADLLLKLISYNVFSAFKRDVFPEEKRWLTIKTVRRMLFLIPAILIYHGRRWILRLSKRYPWKKEWFQIRKNLTLLGYT